MNTLLNYRKSCKISKEISIIQNYSNNEIKIFTDAGRTIRPLFTVEKIQNKLELELKLNK